jgi:hypothetical protein
MGKILKITAFISVAFVIVVVYGCASVESKKANVIIEKESSSLLRFENVRVTRSESNITVRGTLHSRTRSSVPGHIDITFLSTNGEVLQTLKTDYHRGSLKARDYNFKVEVPLDLPEGSTVRLVHHRRSHKENG